MNDLVSNSTAAIVGIGDFKVNTVTGEAFVSQRKSAELCGVALSTLQNFLRSENISAEQGLTAENLSFSVGHYASKLRPEAVATLQMFADAGAKAYIYHQAGYKVSAEPPPQPQFNLPTTYLDALKFLVAETEAHQETKFKAKQVITQASAALVDTTQRLNAAAVELSETRPKAQAFDDVLDKGDNVLISEAAKVLGVKQPDLFNWMAANGWIFRRSLKRPWQAYADRIHNNLLEHRYTNGTDSDGRDHTKCQVTVTPAGIVVLRGLLHAA